MSKHNCGSVMDKYSMLTGDMHYNIGGLAFVFGIVCVCV